MDPAAQPEHLQIQNIAFEPEIVVITYTSQADVRLAGNKTVIVHAHQVTVTRTEDFAETIDGLEEDVRQLVLDVAAAFVKASRATEGAAQAAADDQDDDEFRGMGE